MWVLKTPSQQRLSEIEPFGTSTHGRGSTEYNSPVQIRWARLLACFQLPAAKGWQQQLKGATMTTEFEELSAFNGCRIEVENIDNRFWPVVAYLDNGERQELGDCESFQRAQQLVSSIWHHLPLLWHIAFGDRPS